MHGRSKIWRGAAACASVRGCRGRGCLCCLSQCVRLWRLWLPLLRVPVCETVEVVVASAACASVQGCGGRGCSCSACRCSGRWVLAVALVTSMRLHEGRSIASHSFMALLLLLLLLLCHTYVLHGLSSTVLPQFAWLHHTVHCHPCSALACTAAPCEAPWVCITRTQSHFTDAPPACPHATHTLLPACSLCATGLLASCLLP